MKPSETSTEKSPALVREEEFINSFITAKKAIDDFEIQGSVPIPSVNEIRYAIRHVLDAKNKEQQGEDGGDDWIRAKRHTERARYDVPEFNNSLYTRKISEFLHDFSEHEKQMSIYIDDFYTHLKHYYDYSTYLTELHEFDKEAPAYVKQCENYVRNMRAFCDAIDRGIDMLCHHIEAENKEKAREASQQRIIAWVTIFLGAIVTRCIGLFIS